MLNHINLVFLYSLRSYTLSLNRHMGNMDTGGKTTSKSNFWPTMMKDIALFLASCPVCEKFKKPAKIHKDPLHPIGLPKTGGKLAMDLMDGRETLTETYKTNKYLNHG